MKYKDKDWLYEQYIVQKKSTPMIARELNCANRTIYYWLLKHQINPRTRPEARHNYAGNNVVLTDTLKQFLQGELLGDGNLRTNNFSASYRHASKYKDYVIWLSGFLNKFGVSQAGNIKPIKKQINNKIFTTYYYNSLNYEEFKILYDSFYENKVKHIPVSLNLTPLVVRQWYIGDGSLTIRKFGNPYISIATYGFSTTDIELIIKKFKEINLMAKKRKAGKRKNGQQRYIIAFPVSETNSFFKYIGECPNEIENIYGYKWNI